MRKQAFTLAEIMIVLSVIGILTAILLPVAFHSAPDENIMKFKKANNTLGIVIRELVNSDKYYSGGLLSKGIDGNKINDESYFCKTFSDIISVKKSNCNSFSSHTDEYSHIALDWQLSTRIDSSVEEHLDKACIAVQSAEMEQNISSDGIIFYETSQKFMFSEPKMTWMWDRKAANSYNHETNAYTEDNDEHYYSPEWAEDTRSPVGKFYYNYKIFCFDVDGMNKGQDPFGYGIRIDGKILQGKRAQEWINKSFQNE